ncbi:MAG: hypothetical protein ACD_22C00254G0001 [uncultured bacterium]|nr:MAG: hypothetical protein ACD_22C00254G0001 [uncultured bacterium]
MQKKNDPIINIGNNLQLLLNHYSFSLRELSKAINVTHSHLSKVKRKVANPSIGLTKKIADFFKISIAQLIGEQAIDFEKLPKKTDRNSK